MASYARNWERFVQEGVSIAGISVDPIENNQAMVAKLLLPFPLLSDPEGRVIKEWDVWNDSEAIAKPSTFAIRKDGSIAWAYEGRDFADRPTDRRRIVQLDSRRRLKWHAAIDLFLSSN